MKIQEACKRTGITKRNIHFYIKEKLITPASNQENGYYDFSEKDCQRLRFIRELRNAELSLSIIRSLLDKPATASYYLTLYVKQLNTQKQQLEQTIGSMHYILEHLPIHPNFSILYALSIDAKIPDPANTLDSDSFDSYDNSLVNHFLWSSFLPDKEFTAYQEFLWTKLNRMTNDAPSDDYQKLHDFLQTLKQRSVDQMFADRSQRYEHIASLDLKGCEEYSLHLRHVLKQILNNEAYITTWKKHYELFFAPNTRIFDSEINELAAEMSPCFFSYRKNIHVVCAMVYQWLHTEEGMPLLLKLQNAFGEQLDLESCHHGQLEAIASLIETSFS